MSIKIAKAVSVIRDTGLGRNHRLLRDLGNCLGSISKIRILNCRIPFYCEWEVTRHCNMNCSFCSTRTDNSCLHKDSSTKEALAIIEQLAAVGTRIIHFSGGEPTLRKDLPELFAKAKEKNIIVSLTTNGSCSVKRPERLLQADLIRVNIGGPRDFHDSLRQFPVAFERAVESIRFLKSANTNPQITAVYTPATSYAMLAEIAELAKSLGVQMILNVLGRNVNCQTDVSGDQTLNDLTSPFYPDYIEVLRKLKRKYENTVSSSEPIPTIIKRGGLDVFGCRAMDIAICIKSDGSVSLPCTALSLKLVKGNLRDIYYGKEAIELRALQGRHPACKACYVKCMCSASALLTTRGLLAIASAYVDSLS